MTAKTSTLKKHMNFHDQYALGDLPTWHSNCIDKCGVARPGKTARDKANGHVPYRRNHREYDKQSGKTIKL